MNQEQDEMAGQADASRPQQQQQQQPDPEAHAGQGADSAMKQLRAWEERRATHSGGKGRQGPS